MTRIATTMPGSRIPRWGHALRTIAVVAIGIVLAGQTHAAIIRATVRPYPIGQSSALAGANSTAAICQLGETGAPATSLDIIDFSTGEDTYYTYVAPDSVACPACGSNSYAYVTAAHTTLYFPVAPETVAVAVTLVSSVPIVCHYPNFLDPGEVLCGPDTAIIVCLDPFTILDVTVPLPPQCTIRQKPSGPGEAFIGFRFLSTTHPDSGQHPHLTIQVAPRACRSFNPVGVTAYDVVTAYGIANPVMYVDVEACSGLLDVGSERIEAAPVLRAVLPNPARTDALIRFSNPGRDAADLRVTDLAGRTVARLASAPAEAGLSEARWNLRDTAGKRVRPGLYWVVLRAGTQRDVRAIAVLP